MEITGLGYLGFESPDPAAWRTYGPNVIGFGLAPSPDDEPDSVFLRMDDRAHRIVIRPGPIDQLAYIGWEISGRRAYRRAVTKLDRLGVPAETADEALCARRGVREMTRFHDPVGYVHEIFYAQKSQLRSFTPGRDHGRFDAEELGMGHVVLATPVFDEVLEYFLFEVLGLEWFGGGPVANKVGFYRPPLSPRSHCLGYAHTPGKIGVQHIGLPYRDLDDIGIAFDVAEQEEATLQRTIGRHIQEPVISFYLFAPGGFLIECFHEAGDWNKVVEVNPDRITLWGHKWLGPVFGSSVRPI